MAAYDLQEQEELDNFKRFWHSWGKWAFLVLVLAALGYLGYVIYQTKIGSSDAKAAVLLNHMAESAQANNQNAVLKDLKDLQENHAKSISAIQGTLLVAAASFDEGKVDVAEKHLLWAQAQNKNPMIAAQILQRLAAVKLQQQKFDDALALAQTKVEPDYDVMMLELQGDIYLAKGDSKTAKVKYQDALAKADKQLPGYELLQLKAAQS